MERLLMELPVLLLAACVLWKIRLVSAEEDGLSMEQTVSFRGILAVSILFHHLSQQAQCGVLFLPFQHFGGMIVSMFFFYSGYGVQKKNRKSPDYRKQFLGRRLPDILIPYAFANLVYALVLRIPIPQVLMGLVNGDPIVSYSWYVLHILFFYLAFYGLMCCFGQRRLPMVLSMALLTAAWVYTAKEILVFPAFWYGTSHLLVVGMIWASWEQTLSGCLKKHFLCSVSLSGLGFALLFVLSRSRSGAAELVLKSGMYVCFVLLVLCLLSKVRMVNPILQFLGSISFELYLVHGLMILLLKDLPLPPAFFCLAVLGTSILCAWACRALFRRLAGK